MAGTNLKGIQRLYDFDRTSGSTVNASCPYPVAPVV